MHNPVRVGVYSRVGALPDSPLSIHRFETHAGLTDDHFADVTPNSSSGIELHSLSSRRSTSPSRSYTLSLKSPCRAKRLASMPLQPVYCLAYWYREIFPLAHSQSSVTNCAFVTMYRLHSVLTRVQLSGMELLIMAVGWVLRVTPLQQPPR